MSQQSEISTSQVQQDSFDLDIKEILGLCLLHWRWFVLSIILAIGVAFYYLLSTPPTYSSSASVLMTSNAPLGTTSDMGMDVSLFTGGNRKSNNVYNDVEIFKSPALMLNVVKNLNLEMNYYREGVFRDYICYGSTLPAQVKFLELDDSEVINFTFDVGSDSTYTIHDMFYSGLAVNMDPIKGYFGDTMDCPVGKFIVTPTQYYKLNKKKIEEFVTREGNNNNIEDVSIKRFKVVHSNLYSVSNNYSKAVKVELSGERSTTILLSLNNTSSERVVDVLNMLINVFNDEWLKSKNQIATSTSMFIDERLSIIEKELGHVDQDISSFKSTNKMPDIEQASRMYMTKSETVNTQLLELNNELYMARYIRNYLVTDSHSKELLPVNTGLKNSSIGSQIAVYNEKLLQRNNLVAKSSEKNPLVQQYDKELQDMRNSIVISVDQEVMSLNTKIDDLKRTDRETTKSIQSSPNQAKYLLSIERQQKVKEALYLYLLQKREENELSQAFTAYNTRIISPPSLAVKVSPKASQIFMTAIAIAFMLPIAIVICMLLMNTTVRGKEDLKQLTLPFVGEIPYYVTDPKELHPSLWRRISKYIDTYKRWIESFDFNKNKKKKLNNELGNNEKRSIIVSHGKRDILNEAFRVLRTNVEYLVKKNTTNVISITSIGAGSGKTFIAANFAASLAIRGAKVVVVDCDLRHASCSSYVNYPKHGVSDFLSGRVDNVDNLIIGVEDVDNLYILPVGTIPPNPAELLAGEPFRTLIDYLRGMFDYIILDCPPIDIVADVQIVNEFVDNTMFVARVGLLERSVLSEVEQMYKDNRFNNMSIILNAVKARGKYGYRYGYRYGYNYGYKSYYYGDTSRS